MARRHTLTYLAGIAVAGLALSACGSNSLTPTATTAASKAAGAATSAAGAASMVDPALVAKLPAKIASAGKIVVDITNPVNFETFDSLVVPAHSSAAAELAEALPDSKVVKGFNTNFAGTLAAGTLGDLATTVLIAGDDADAKKTLADVVAAGGVKVIDAGPLSRARELEAVGFLQITLAAAEKVSWVGGFGVVA